MTGHVRLAFRPDIEGLRAVAILLVVAGHAGVPALSGGFIGVDIFFVLSGYLITGLLVQEQQASGRIAFAHFYARRLRRLLPALMLMIACSCGLGALLLPVTEQPHQAIAGAAAAAWVSNIHFAVAKLDYFSPGAEENLFLHTWSLGVEEQFYLAWPLLLAAVLGRTSNVRRLMIAMVLVLIVSFLLSIALTPRAAPFAFYMMPARAWQFSLGALTFLKYGILPGTNGTNGSSGGEAWPALAGWAGLLAIFISALMLDGRQPYPGLWALLPSGGTALVLVAGATEGSAGVQRLLSLAPMQVIGRISYAWYLWHWPVLLLSATLVGMHTMPARIASVSLSLALAALSYRFVEYPLRHSARLISRPRLALFVAAVLIVMINSIAIRWSNNASDEAATSGGTPWARARTDGPLIYSMPCDSWYHSKDVNLCVFGPSEAEHAAIVMGDSMGLQWFPALAKIFDRPGWQLIVLTKSACPMVDLPYFYPKIGREYVECEIWRRNALLEIARRKPDILILGSSYTYGFSEHDWTEGTIRVLQQVSHVSGSVAILRSTPVLPFNAPSCASPRSRLHTALASSDRCRAAADSTEGDMVLHALQSAAARFGNVRVLDMNDAVCPAGVCHAEQGGMIAFRDSQHMTATYVASLANVLAARMAFDTQHSRANSSSANTAQ